jgi:tryptophan-rich sensory protein
VAQWSTIAACAALSARVSRLSAALLLPYLGWTGFASALNGRIWQLNRGRGSNG